ncbi:hypothetical protein [Acinetobacter sp. ANC 3789]|nr:hypothetical protein [Acinetobacter sp. ANC 3789]
MPNITEILEGVEKLMEKYGFWKVTGFVILAILAWQLPQIITASRWW